MIRFILILTLFVSSLLNLYGQTDYAADIYNAYVEGDMERWREIIDEMKAKNSNKSQIGKLMQLTQLEYGYIAYCIGNGDDEEAKEILYDAEENIGILLEFNSSWAEAYALKGAFLGYRIGMDLYKAVTLGPESSEYIDKALELDRTNPRVWVESGNADYYMPEMFGGSKDRAIESYEKAVELYENNPLGNENNWLYLNTLAILAQAYDNTGQINKAQQTYKKILEIEPDFAWVKNDLYPDFKEENGL